MEDKELSHFKLERDGTKLELRRGMDADAVSAAIARMPMPYQQAPAAVASAPSSSAPAAPSTGAEESSGPCIDSPMVGTFYRASSPGDDPFIKVGDSVDEDTVVCIIEAMKVLNEIKAETRGTITKILLSDATPVQYGEPLFEIAP